MDEKLFREFDVRVHSVTFSSERHGEQTDRTCAPRKARTVRTITGRSNWQRRYSFFCLTPRVTFHDPTSV